MNRQQDTAAPRRAASGNEIDFAAVANLALGAARHLLPRWFPAGRVRGQNFTVGNIRGNRGESLSVSLTNGRWIDFAAPAYCGGDLISLNAARLGVSQVEAARLVCAELGITSHVKAWDNRRQHSAPRPALPPLPEETLQQETEDQRRNIALALRIWAARRALPDSPAARDLQSRRLPVFNIEDLAFHPRCPRAGGTASAMIALMRDAVTGEPCGIHWTFLLPDGNGKDDSACEAKMMLGRAKGAVIMLTPFAEVTTGLAVTEGIENGLSLMKQGMAPLWACASAVGIASLPVLKDKATGRIQYSPVVEWPDRTTADKFSAAVIDVVEAAHPGAVR